MITFVGFSPAWQQVYCVDRYAPGDVIRAREAFHYASGKATNAAIVASKSTVLPVQLATIAGGSHGRLFESDLMRHRLIVKVVGPAETRICTTIIPDDGSSTEFIENAPAIRSDVADQLLSEVVRSKPTAIACCGSLPPGVPTNVYAQFVRATQGPTVVDAAGLALTEALEAGPLVVKPNLNELARTTGLDITPDSPPDDPVLREAMQLLIDRGAQSVLVTNGAAPATLLTRDGLETFVVPVVRKLVNPIGAGDSLTGAMLAALSEGRSLRDSVGAGLTAASQKCERLRPELEVGSM